MEGERSELISESHSRICVISLGVITSRRGGKFYIKVLSAGTEP